MTRPLPCVAVVPLTRRTHEALKAQGLDDVLMVVGGIVPGEIVKATVQAASREQLLDAILEANRPQLPRFFSEDRR